MTDLGKLDDIASIEPQEFAQLVKNTPVAEITAILQSDHRTAILDSIFAKMASLFRPDRAGSTSAVIQWNITGRPDGGVDTYELVVENATCTLSPKPENEPTLSLTVAPVDFVKVASGNGNPVMMFMTGKLKAKGDLGLAANISNLFDIPKP